MKPAELANLVEKVGIPLLTAAAAGYDLWWLIRWLTTSFKKDLTEDHEQSINEIRVLKEELDEEVRDTRDILSEELKKLNVMTVRLVDRIRTLELNFIEHDETVRALYGLTRANRRRTRHETVEDLHEQIKDAGKTNGD